MFRSRWLLAMALLLGIPTFAGAQISATEAGYAFATVEQIPITLTLSETLLFGRFVPHGRQGWIQVSSTNSPSTTASSVTILSQGRPARWSVTGTPNAPFTVVLPADRTISLSSGADTMVIDFMFSSYNETGTSPLLSNGGTAAFAVGARLLVKPNQSPGVYSGSFPVTVAY